MRKMTAKAIQAFNEGKNFKSGNTEVTNGCISLHKNEIARKDVITGEVSISNAGWFSPTTKERLNGIPGVSIHQRKGIWYLNGKEWDGKWIKVETFPNPTR
jgi:hypothetical protein